VDLFPISGVNVTHHCQAQEICTDLTDAAGQYEVITGFSLWGNLEFTKDGYDTRTFHLPEAAVQDIINEDLYRLDVRLPPR
jgi:hypothetical protein